MLWVGASFWLSSQLNSWGFQDRGTFFFYGKEMICYALDLQASHRVDPVSRHPAV
jgi:hypothetical protein